ncbi:MAG: histidine phosphatase family protein [Defluviitaleaceae bacterium]|nr:histidine phosphatase family protein [Defluviitaleaceae bacterium]
MKIFTVRHGQTSWNLERRLQGHTDIPLDETGMDQARRIGLRLAGEKVDAIYTSDLQRARKTAETINAHHGAQLFATSKLREISFGKYEGQLIEKISEKINWNHPDPDGEDVAAVFSRIHSFLDEVVESGHENVIIVGHYGSVRAAICYFLGIPAGQRHSFNVGNTAIHCFERATDGTFQMVLENDTSHLNG